MVSFSRVYQILEPRLNEHEGVRLKPYRDSRGLWTIGIGRCLDTKGISIQEAKYLLDHDMEEAVMSVVEHIPWAENIDENRFSVLAEMAFQMGIGGLLLFRQTLHYLEIGDYELAALAMLDSKWAKEDSPKRALELSEIIRRG
jgi:lysozyme